jgi:hypothetical protein
MRRRVLQLAIGLVLGTALLLAVWPARRELERWVHRRFLELTVDEALWLVALAGIATAVAAFVRRADALAVPRRRLAERASSLRLPSVPVGIALPLLVSVGAVVRIVIDQGASIPRVFADELIYANLAKSFAATGTLLLRGVEDNGHSILYPVLISPIYAATGDGVAAHEAVQTLNALVASLAAVPGYFLARRILSQNWSLAVAGLSVLIPGMSYSALVMTESLFYPGFVAFALVLVLVLERPTIARQLLVAATLVALVGVRTQAIALAPAVATAATLQGWRVGGLRALLARLWPLWTILVLVAAGFLAASRAGASAPTGAYGDLIRLYNPVEVAKWGFWSIGHYALGVGLVAVAAAAVSVPRLLRHEATRAQGAVGAVVVSLVLWTLGSVAVLAASPYGLGILHDRSLFYVTPLVLVCFAHWLAAGLPRPPLYALGVSGALLCLAALVPERLLLHPSLMDNPVNVVWLGLHDRMPGVSFRLLVLVVAALGVAVFLHARGTLLPLFSFALMALFVTTNLDLHTSPERPHTDRLAWIDDALPDDARAAIVHVAIDTERCPAGANTSQSEAVVWSEFFNTSVDRIYHVLGPVGDDGLASPELQIAADGTLLLEGTPLHVRYAALDSRVRIHGTKFAQLDLAELLGFSFDGPGQLSLWEADGPLRLVSPAPLLHGTPEDVACPRAQ